jgi:protocatechuate 3,4-dioxygenase beta subunit
MKSNEINRRGFLKASALFAVVVSVPAFVACKDDTDASDLNQGNCKTTEDILGPYYKAGAPFREDIRPDDSSGTPLIIEGKVFTNCDVALADAIVEIWNANAEGAYDTSNQYLFRGIYKTAADGAYRFKTIIPGKYLNGNYYRPSHIHFRITAPGQQELVSQVYFKDDPDIARDSWASNPKARERILNMEKDANGVDKVIFDIYLTKLG